MTIKQEKGERHRTPKHCRQIETAQAHAFLDQMAA